MVGMINGLSNDFYTGSIDQSKEERLSTFKIKNPKKQQFGIFLNMKIGISGIYSYFTEAFTAF
jgi:hypothetical protein